jgi:hypothetical protein
MMHLPRALARFFHPPLCVAVFLGCAAPSAAEQREMTVTAYCKCGECNSYSRGSWKLLKLDFWRRYVNAGSDKGRRYTGKTANGGKLAEPRPGLVSGDSVRKPWMIPVRIVGFPFLLMSRKGTIAADTDYYPFGTEMYVPGYGWGVVKDRGGAIKGPERLDVYFNSHRRTEEWGRQRLTVEIRRP